MAIDFTRPLRTKDGRHVKIVSTEGRGDYPILGYIGDSDVIDNWTAEGEWRWGTTDESDLENVPRKVKGWINIYDPSDLSDVAFRVSHVFPSKKQADKDDEKISPVRLACIEIEVEIP